MRALTRRSYSDASFYSRRRLLPRTQSVLALFARRSPHTLELKKQSATKKIAPITVNLLELTGMNSVLYFGEIKNKLFSINELFFKERKHINSRSSRSSTSYVYWVCLNKRDYASWEQLNTLVEIIDQPPTPLHCKNSIFLRGNSIPGNSTDCFSIFFKLL